MALALAVVCFVDRGNLSGGLAGVMPDAVIFGLLALGGGIVVASSLIDLSAVGLSVLCGVAFTIALSWAQTLPWSSRLPVTVQVAAALLVAAGLAVLSGCFVARCVVDLRAPPLIFTWALGSIYVILAILSTSFAAPTYAHSVSGIALEPPIHSWFWAFAGPGFYWSAGSIVAIIVVVHGINLPQRAAAIGAGEKSARYAGVSKRRTLYECFVVSATLACLAGLFEATYIDTASTRDLVGKELIPIAIAVLGGTALSGGFINLFSIVAAAIFWSSVQHLGPELPRLLPWLPNESEVGQILFFVIFAFVVVWTGRSLTPSLPKIYARKE